MAGQLKLWTRCFTIDNRYRSREIIWEGTTGLFSVVIHQSFLINQNCWTLISTQWSRPKKTKERFSKLLGSIEILRKHHIRLEQRFGHECFPEAKLFFVVSRPPSPYKNKDLEQFLSDPSLKDLGIMQVWFQHTRGEWGIPQMLTFTDMWGGGDEGIIWILLRFSVPIIWTFIL